MKILLGILILLSLFTCVSCEQLNYTDSFNTYTTTQISNNVSYELYSDNSFDTISIYQNSAFTIGEYYNNISFSIYEHEYKIQNKYIVTLCLIPGLYNVEHKTTVYNDGEFRTEQIEEYRTYKICTSVFKNKIFMGTYGELENSGNKIYMEQMVSTWKGSYRYYTYVCDIPSADIGNIKHVTIDKTSFTGLLIFIDYMKYGTHPVHYYTEQLSEPLQFLYLGFKLIDTDQSILNVLLLSQYVMDMLFFAVSTIAKSFFTLLFIFLIAGVPTLSFANSHNQKGFIDGCIRYYIITFEVMCKFLSYVINIGLRLVDLVNPF